MSFQVHWFSDSGARLTGIAVDYVPRVRHTNGQRGPARVVVVTDRRGIVREIRKNRIHFD